MDKILLKALDNLSVSLEKISEALGKKGDDKGQSATTSALKSGDFSKQLTEINTSVKSIKVDTQKILKNQETIIQLQKQKGGEKKTEAIEESGGEKKKGQIKKGVATILLIAVAVLAIGMAFKLVGKVDFLSVISLGLAIVLISIAFEKIAKLNLSIKQAAMASLTMVMMSAALTVSSWVLSLIKPIGFTQLLTAIFIAATFAVMSKSLVNIFTATILFDKLKVSKLALLTTLVSISAAITASSWAFQLIMPISFAQAMTAIAIAAVFSIIAFNMHKIGVAVVMFERLKVKPTELIKTLLGIATAITVSSWVLGLVRPMSFGQIVTAVLIAAMFAIVAFNMEKIAAGVVAFKKTKVSPVNLILVLVGIAAAITASSWILSLTKPIGLWQFVTALGITILFAIMSYFMEKLAIGVVLVEKLLGKGKIFLIPLVLVAMSLAIMLSSHILKKMADIPFMLMLKILVFSIILTLAVIVLGIAALFLVKVVGTSNIAKGSLSIVMLAASIMLASILLSKGTYTKYPGWRWTLLTAIAIIAFGLVAKILTMLGGVGTYVKGGIAILIVALTIMVTSHILAAGNYKKFPTLKWSLGVALALGIFGVAALLLGTQTMNPFFYAGLGIILLVAVIILATSHILAAGNYKKYPTLSWNLGVAAALATFGVAAILLGFNALNPFFYAGLGIVLLVAGTIVGVADILAKGKYNLPGIVGWSASVALLYTVFTPLIILLGAVGAMGAVVEFFGGKNPFEEGRKMLKDIAWSIVDVSKILQKGDYKQGPTEAWAKGVGIALGAFSPVYQMLVDNAPGLFSSGGGVGPDDFAKAIRTVSHGIISAAWYFSKNKAAFVNGPPVAWAKGVGLAIGAFAPVYSMLVDFPYSGGSKMKRAIILIAEGVVAAAGVFSKNKARFEEGKYPSKEWGRGVGASLNAFAPVFEALSGRSWYESGDGVINNMKNGIIVIAKSLVSAARAFMGVKPEAWKSYPTVDWAKGVGKTVEGFMNLFDTIEERGYTTTSFAMNSMILKFGVQAMADVARILWTNQKFFKVKLDQNFVKNLSKNLLGFGTLALKLDKMLVSEKTVVTTNSGVFGIGSSKSTKTVRERRDLSLVKDLTIQLISVAKILWENKKYFEFKIDPSYVQNLSKNLLGFGKLALMLDKLLVSEKTVTTVSSGFFGIGASKSSTTVRERKDLSLVKDLTIQLISVAKILWENKKYFAFKIDPNYMKNVGKNILDFNQVIKKLGEAEEGTSFFGRIGQGIESMLGTDPISQIVRRMVTLAKGYDALASSLMKLGFAMRTLNLKNMKDLGTMTRDLADGKMPKKSGSSSSGTEMQMPKQSKMASVGDRVSDKKLNPERYLTPEQAKRNSLHYLSKQMDQMIGVLSSGTKGDKGNPVVDKLDEILKLLKEGGGSGY